MSKLTEQLKERRARLGREIEAEEDRARMATMLKDAIPQPVLKNDNSDVLSALTELSSMLSDREQANIERNEAMLEVLGSLTPKDIDLSPIGEAIERGISSIPAVKIPRRKARSYYATVDRDDDGEMVGARIDPI